MDDIKDSQACQQCGRPPGNSPPYMPDHYCCDECSRWFCRRHCEWVWRAGKKFLVCRKCNTNKSHAAA